METDAPPGFCLMTASCLRPGEGEEPALGGILANVRCWGWTSSKSADWRRVTDVCICIDPGAPLEEDEATRPRAGDHAASAFRESSGSVVFRTEVGSGFQALLRSAEATFEIDGIDEYARTGWSVIMIGVVDEVTNPNEISRLDGLALDSWAAGAEGPLDADPRGDCFRPAHCSGLLVIWG